jgi:hypothetical protein
LKPAQASSSRGPISKKPITKSRTCGVAQGVGLEFKPQYCKKKKKKKQTTGVGVFDKVPYYYCIGVYGSFWAY